jgi:hypothetical protein
MQPLENVISDDALCGAWTAFFISVSGGVAVRAKLSLEYSKWMAVATGVVLAFALNKLPLVVTCGQQSSLILGALLATASLFCAAVVYRHAIALAPLGELTRLRNESSEISQNQDQAALNHVRKKFADDVEESGFLGSILRAMAAMNFERAAKLANSKVKDLERLAKWQFILVVGSGLCIVLSEMLRAYCNA